MLIVKNKTKIIKHYYTTTKAEGSEKNCRKKKT